MNDKEREKLERLNDRLAARIASIEEWRDNAGQDASDLNFQINDLWKIHREYERVPLTHGSGTGGK